MNKSLPNPIISVGDWVLLKKYNTPSRVVDIKVTEEGFFRYGVTDRLDDLHYLKVSELVKLVDSE